MNRVPAAAEKNTKNAVEKDRRDAPDMEQKIKELSKENLQDIILNMNLIWKSRAEVNAVIKLRKSDIQIGIIVLLLLVCAEVIRYADRMDLFEKKFGILRSMIYIGLMCAWGISIRKRILKMQVRRYLVAVSVLIVFWLAVRTIKFHAASDLAMRRHLWYAYYVPMLSIPVCSIFVALSLGRPEKYRLPKWLGILWLPSAMLLFLVLTNDFHQWVFTFPAGKSWSDHDYRYAFCYWLTLAWEMLGALAAFLIIAVKCRIPDSKKIYRMPLILIFLLFLYGIFYALGFVAEGTLLHAAAGDLTAVCCLLIAAIFESCIRCGMICSNTGYDQLFQATTAKMQITDEQWRIRYHSADSNLPPETLAKAACGAFRLDRNTLLKSSPIRGGHVAWQEDISALVCLKEELEAVQEELQERNQELRIQYERDAARCKLEEENRLYDLLQSQTQKQLREIKDLTANLRGMDKSTQEARRMLCRIVVLATYIKRRKDMALLTEKNQVLPVDRLADALRESEENLALWCAKANFYKQTDAVTLPADRIITAYDFFEDILETAFASLTYLMVSLCQDEEGEIRLSVHADGDMELSMLQDAYPLAELEKEEDGWFLSLPVGKGGCGG